MAYGFCSNCKIELSLDNAEPSRVKTGNGRCIKCKKEYLNKNKERIKRVWSEYHLKNRDNLLSKAKLYGRTPQGKHKVLKVSLRRENIIESDLLWVFNFYAALIQDGICHYCFEKLSETGGGLDRVDNEIGHMCYNVVPCCDKCNSIKSWYLTYEEMMMLAPALKEIAKLKSLRQIDPSLEEKNGTI